MTINITPIDITIDETVGLFNDDIASAPAGYETLLNDLNSVSDDGFPQYAFKDNFVTATPTAGETVTGLSMKWKDGTEYKDFSATEGVATTMTLTGGTTPIYLFAHPSDPNVILGIVGDDPSGEVAFAFILKPDGTTAADAYIVQFASLDHPLGGANHDDTIDLTNLVHVAASGTATVTFSDFSDAPSGNPQFVLLSDDSVGDNNQSDQKILVTAFNSAGANETVNTSEQGLGCGPQSVGVGAGLIIDFVTGGSSSVDTSSTDNISYTEHVETDFAGFTLVQVNPASPNTALEILITAQNVSGEPQGATLVSQSLDANAATDPIVDLEKVVVRDALGNIIETAIEGQTPNPDATAVVVTFNADGTVKVTGLKDDYSVEVYSTDGNMFDRIIVKNVDPDIPANNSFDLGAIKFAGTVDVAAAAEVGSKINFDDDGPTLGLATEFVAPTLTVDESYLASGNPANQDAGEGQSDNASADFSGAFVHSFGVDEEGASLLYSLNAAAGQDTGLTDTESGFAVVTAIDGVTGDVLGVVQGTSHIVFSVSANEDTGVVTLTQYRAVVHENTGSVDESTGLANGVVINLVASIEDGDADTATDATFNIASYLNFEDDGPSISAVAADKDSLLVDESFLVCGSGLDPDGDSKTNVATLAAATLFLATPAYGADREGNTVGDFELVLGDLTGYNSGLFDTETGEEVTLIEDGGVIFGVIDDNGTDRTVFTVSIDATGEVTLTQSRAVVHPASGEDQANNSDIVYLNTLESGPVIGVKASITDGDNDSADALADITEAIAFRDDGPDLKASTAIDVEFKVSEKVVGNMLETYGADGKGSIFVNGVTYHEDDLDLTIENDVYTFTHTESGDVIATFSIDDCGDFAFEILNTGRSQFEDWDMGSVKPGRPVETVTIGTEHQNAQITINGLDFQIGKEAVISIANWQNADVGAGDKKRSGLNDDINANNLGFGIVGDVPSQASQINHNEGFCLTFDEPTDKVRIDIQNIGNSATSVHVEYLVTLEDGATVIGKTQVALLNGNALSPLTLDYDQDIASVVYKFTFEGSDVKNPSDQNVAGVRVANISVWQEDTIPDYDFAFNLKIEDKDDADYDTATLTFNVSPDHGTEDISGTQYAEAGICDCDPVLELQQDAILA